MKRPYLLIFLLSLVLNSCQSNLSFDNIEFDSEVSLAVSLINFDFTQTDFIDTGNNPQVITVSDTTDFVLLSGDIIKDNINSMSLTFAIDNNFERDILFDVVFLNSDDERVHVFENILVNANTTDFLEERTVTVSENPDFVDTEKFNLLVTLIPTGNPVDPNITRSINFDSFGVLNLGF